MYAIYPKNGNTERDFDNLITSVTDEEKRKLMTTLAKYPKGVARSRRVEHVGRVEKKGNFWQYYAPYGNRIIYDVIDYSKRVIVLFAGDHEEAAIWLRKNSGRK